ncbi:TonB-dependent receptor [candidate division KSB1 bacterium]|nr:TonB-dependent receptor [candidate division KSB1 bacterium]
MKLKPRCLFLLATLLLPWILHAATIHGFVREKASREPVIMANVWLKGTNIGTTTNTKGYYVLSALPPGKYEIYFRFIGFKTFTQSAVLTVETDLEINILLEEEPIQMEAAVVTAERDQRELDIKPGQISMLAPQLRSMPQIAEPDLFRSIQMLPGVATLSDFSAGLYIRGGSTDQNLILLDQIDVYNPNHMFGFFSTFNTDAIKSVELLKGGFPAMYGGRLSSVLNVVNKEGNREEFQGVARLSLLGFNATLEGPWKKGSWMISGRRSYLDLATKMVDIDLPYYFYDGHAKINYDLNKTNQFSLSAYWGNDNLDLSQDGTSIKLDWGNKTFSSQWTHLFSSQLFSHFVFAGSRFDSDTRVTFDDIAFGVLNRITDLSLKGTLTYSPSIRHSMDFGFEGKKLNMDLNYEVVGIHYLNGYDGHYLAAYFQDNYRLGLFDIIQTGLRLDHYTDGSYSNLTPRLSWKHLLHENLNFTASYGRYIQYLNLVQQEGLSFADMWFPVDETFPPGKADHYILGANYDNKRSFSINIEGYYKPFLNIAEYRTFRGADESMENQTAAQNFFRGRGKAYGLDLYLRNNLFGFEGWIGYSLSWTKKRVQGYNFDQEYYPTYDRRHTLTIMEDYHLSRKWRLNFAFKYGSGQPYTEATARYAAMRPNGSIYDRVLDGKKNFYRLPAYHRLDLALFYNTRWFGVGTEIYLQIVNVYDQENVWYRYYQTAENPARVKDFNQIPFLPTFGISFNF